MDNPQYPATIYRIDLDDESFKPYYKWITLNTEKNIKR